MGGASPRGKAPTNIFCVTCARILAVVTLALLVSCSPASSQNSPARSVRAQLLERTGAFQSHRLRESSGVAPSRAHPGILWTHNDSGDGPILYATSVEGADLGAYHIAAARATDWEDIGLGPCPRHPQAPCLYIADVGDNYETRHGGTIYVVREPTPPTGPVDTARSIPLEWSVRVRYLDGSHDTESILVGPTGDVSLVTKGRSGPILRYWLPRSSIISESVSVWPHDTIPITPSRSVGRWATGGAVAPSGRLAVIRTYTELYFFRIAGDTLAIKGPPCWLGPAEPQGEGVGFLDERTLVLTSEAVLGEPGIVSKVRCSNAP